MLDTTFALLGRQVSQRVAPSNHAFPHRAHEEDRPRKLISTGVVEGLNNKANANVAMRKPCGLRTLYRSLGKLPEPESTDEFSRRVVLFIRVHLCSSVVPFLAHLSAGVERCPGSQHLPHAPAIGPGFRSGCRHGMQGLLHGGVRRHTENPRDVERRQRTVG